LQGGFAGFSLILNMTPSAPAAQPILDPDRPLDCAIHTKLAATELNLTAPFRTEFENGSKALLFLFTLTTSGQSKLETDNQVLDNADFWATQDSRALEAHGQVERDITLLSLASNCLSEFEAPLENTAALMNNLD
jgi:hypothetical protein